MKPETKQGRNYKQKVLNYKPCSVVQIYNLHIIKS